MRRNLAAFIFVLFLGLGVVPISRSAEAAVLQFNPTTFAIRPNDTVSISVNVDAKTDTIAGVEAHINYDANLLQPQSVSAGTFFPVVSNDISNGKVNIVSVVQDASQYKSGSGTIATIVFKALAEGTGTVTFDCDLSRSDASKVVKNDFNATNLIECNSLGTLGYTISNGATNTGGTGSNGGGTTGNTGTSTGTGSTSPTQLMQSGVIENLRNISIPAFILVAVGVSLKLFLVLAKNV